MNPQNNDRDGLVERVKELNEMNDAALKKLAEKARETKTEFEGWNVEEEIKKNTSCISGIGFSLDDVCIFTLGARYTEYRESHHDDVWVTPTVLSGCAPPVFSGHPLQVEGSSGGTASDNEQAHAIIPQACVSVISILFFSFLSSFFAEKNHITY